MPTTNAPAKKLKKSSKSTSGSAPISAPISAPESTQTKIDNINKQIGVLQQKIRNLQRPQPGVKERMEQEVTDLRAELTKLKAELANPISLDGGNRKKSSRKFRYYLSHL
jgi:hypothetical protein